MIIKDFEIPDYGIIKISEYGDIYGINDYSKKRTLSIDKDGYFRINIKYRKKHVDENGIERKYYKQFVHRLVATCFLENPNNYPVVNHKDGNKQNNHYTNLEWCTVKYNNQHAKDNNLYAYREFKGETNPHNKLNKEDVLKIREEYSISKDKGYKFYDKYSSLYNVDRETIRHICKRITWKYI